MMRPDIVLRENRLPGIQKAKYYTILKSDIKPPQYCQKGTK